MSGTTAEKHELAADPATPPDGLAAVAPGYQDPSPDLDLIRLALAHPNVPAGVMARYAGSLDRDIRWLVAHHPDAPGTALQVLELDSDPAIAKVAHQRLHP